MLLPEINVHTIAAFTDNYIYAMRLTPSGQAPLTAVVDPGDAAPVIAFLEAKGWSLQSIFCTHHHQDHIGGVSRLQERYGCQVYGYAPDAARLPPLSIALEDKAQFQWGGMSCHVIAVPGHTLGHIAYHWPEAKLLFVGDTLFSLGCGRMFEGNAEGMWASLKRLRELGKDPDLRMFAAHEYTLSNLRFALTVDPDNHDLTARGQEAERQRAQGLPTLPTHLANEIKVNPFLRCDVPAFKARHGFAEKSDAAFFGFLRQWKNTF